MNNFRGFNRGMGIGGWLTNYKRFNVLPDNWRKGLTVGDLEHFRSYIGEEDVRYIASLGFDHVRLGFDQIVLEDENGDFREEILALIDEFVANCEKYGLNVVLNLHKAVGNYCDISEPVSLLDDEGLQDGFVRFWLALEERYSNEPKIAFELLNEVRDVPAYKWNDLAERTIAAIRGKNRDRVLIIGSTCWGSRHTLKDLRLYDDENVVYTFHMYEPHEFTHQRGVLMAPQCYYNREMPYPGDVERYRDFHKTVFGNDAAYRNYEKIDEKFINDEMSPVEEFIAAHPDKTLWCGEFGTIRHARLEWREN